MGSLRDIKNRIGSVKKTKKITQAMKMVAASKYKRALDKLVDARVYGDSMKGIYGDLISRLEPGDFPALLSKNEAPKQAVIIVTGDRGLCGGFNAYLLKKAMDFLNTLEENSVDLYLIGNKGIQFFKSRPYSISETYSYILDALSVSHVQKILNPLVELFVSGRYGGVHLFYNEFVSALSTNQIHSELLPLDLDGWDEHKKLGKSDFIYEPSKASVLESFLQSLIHYKLYQSLLESQAAEEGARMAAMDSATENAGEVIDDLTIQFNRSRQAAITTELTEIVAGAASLN